LITILAVPKMNTMKTRLLISLLLLFCAHRSVAGWTNLNTGINDDLNGVVAADSFAVVTGHHGLYYSQHIYSGAASWHRYVVAGNATDSITVSHTRFNHCLLSTSTLGYVVYACGTDTIAGKGIVLVLDITTMTSHLAYTGPAGSALNHIASVGAGYLAVGDHGFAVSINSSSGAITLMTTGTNADLLSINDWSNTDMVMVSRDSIFRATVSGSSISSQRITAPQVTYRDAVYYATSTFGYAAGNKEVSWSSSGASEMTEYDFGPLNARCLFMFDLRVFAGTDHGIFLSDAARDNLEYQPSSLNYRINSIWALAPYNSPLYACGDNGVVLRSATDGETKPVANIHMNGGCVNGSRVFSASLGTATTCRWYVNGTLYSSQCSGAAHTYNTVGTDTIRLEVQNNDHYNDTSIQIINIVPVPAVNMPHVFSKTYICHKEPELITIDSTQPNVSYLLESYSNSQIYAQSPPGNGGQLSFTSDSLSASGSYLLVSSSTMAQCTARFRDTLHLVAEQTHADFYAGYINADPGQAAPFYQHCTDAQHYQWSFSPTPAATTGTASGTATATFNTPGPTQAKLICWSNHGCYDSVTRPTTHVTIESGRDDNCWQLHNIGPDLPWAGAYFPDISQMSPYHDGGFLSCGVHNHDTISSYYGDSAYPKRPVQGSFCARYTSKGMLKWICYASARDFMGNSGGSAISSVVEDRLGNVYIGGGATYLIDTKGDSVYLPTGGYPNGFIAKLDSDGKMIWYLNLDFRYDEYVLGLTIDYDNNVVAMMDNYYQTQNRLIYLNGILTTDTLHNPNLCNYQFVKINPAGHLLWENGVYMNSNNPDYMLASKVDTANNIYVLGGYEYNVTLYSAGSGTGTLMQGHRQYGSTGLISKFDKNGRLLWNTRMLTVGDSSTAPGIDDLYTDSTGNTYITGRNDAYYPNRTQVIENTDHTITTARGGEYYTARIDPQGICRWIEVNKGNSSGGGYGIHKVGNEISVMGLMTSSTPDTNRYFTSHDGHNLNALHTPYMYFVMSYDTAGNIRRLIGDGINNTYPQGASHGVTSFYKTGNNYLFAGNFYRQANYPPYTNFGMPAPVTSGSDGIITKFSPSCGLVYYPGAGNVTGYICPRGTYTKHGHIYRQSGVYTDTLVGAGTGGADSLINLTLLPSPPDTTILYDSICYGASYTYHNQVLHTAGVYTDSLSTTSGCDSVVILHLTVRPLPRDSQSVLICGQGSYHFYGQTLTVAGVYRDTTGTSGGCDSLHILRLTVQDVTRDTQQVAICQGASYAFYGQTLTQAGYYSDTISHINTCDSIHILHLTVHPLPVITWQQADTLVIVFCGHLIPPPDIKNAIPSGGHYSGSFVSNDSIGSSAIDSLHSLPFRDSIFNIQYTYTDTNGCTNTLSKQFRLTYECEAVNDIDGLSSIHIYPNPNHGSFKLETSNNVGAEYYIYDMLGNIIKQHSIGSDHELIEMPGVAAGVYTLLVQGLSGRSAVRFVVEK
jgi:hypothetical protein